jgi:eukaryotic-like serine/threonine-protein kinase
MSLMTPERWKQIDQLFHSALQREPSQRAAFVAESCSGDESLQSEIEDLLASHEQSESFIETPAADVAAELLAVGQTGLTVGQTVGPYKIIDLLGEGGMGEVYLAEDTRLPRKIALKILPPQFTIDAERVHRFEQEARTASALNHPNIVTIHEVGRVNGTQFIVTEFVDGQTLREYMAESQLSLHETLEVAIQVASALAAAHRAEIVHRDIKPENIMLRADGYVKVLDFGLAKLVEQSAVDTEAVTRKQVKTSPGIVIGTVQYMSPEQARAGEVDARTDIWALGVMLYEMVTGHLPFSGETASHVIVSVIEREPLPLAHYMEVPHELERIVTRALSKNKDERYQSASELALDLKGLKQELEVEARLEQSLVPDAGRKRTTKGDGERLVDTGHASLARTIQTAIAHSTSSAEYLVSQMKRHKRGVAFAAVATMIALATLTYAYVRRSGISVVSTDPIESVAVLPFVNVNNDPNAEYLSEGISDSIINSISRLPKLKVISLNAVLRYKGKQTDPQSIGNALKVRAVLMGRMTQQGDSLVISTELVDVRDNRRLWGEQYNRKLSDIIAVQTEIAQAISERLRLRLTGEEKKQLARNYTQDTEAYRLYSLGMHSGRQNTEEALEKGIEYFEQAIKLDPNYALAYTGLFRFYYGLGQAGRRLPTESRRRMEWAAMKAVELDDSSTEAHVELATIRKVNWDWAGSEREYKRAIELDPDSASPYFSYASFLMDVGRADEAMVYATRAEDLNREQHYPSVVAMVYLYQGEYDKAIERILTKNPSDLGQLRNAYLAKGMYKQAIELLEKDVLDDQTQVPWWGYPFRAYAYGLAGRRDAALKILHQQQKAAKERYISPFNFVLIYTGLGDRDRAFEYLNKACEDHVLNLSHFMYGPVLSSLHSDPRYKDILRQMNLTAETYNR